jgi:hypothetical protein
MRQIATAVILGFCAPAIAQFEDCPELTGLYEDYFGNHVRMEQKIEGQYLIYTAHYAGTAESKMYVGQYLEQGDGFNKTYCDQNVVINYNHAVGSIYPGDVNRVYPSNVQDEAEIDAYMKAAHDKKQAVSYLQDVYYKTFLAGEYFETDMTNDITFQNLETKAIRSFKEQTVNRMKRIETRSAN